MSNFDVEVKTKTNPLASTSTGTAQALATTFYKKVVGSNNKDHIK